MKCCHMMGEHVFPASLPFDFVANELKLPARPPLSHIVQSSQLIYVQLLPRITIEGYTIDQGDFHWLDVSFSDHAQPTALSAVVANILSK
ncbi:hypothetical protein K503DRAFT_129391 [Rhizopogon vinicolor AM-OR11-026]|uniref:Uncharacterized protein n=1 Tax=Rhizopogon vinicolor AM-OR11-026 TaxID=1314800 RepID=A0A1B7N201_9AGAM|nr:hypothetical protein K503DRAFT_129391 [Rhizopogon vinicolor AM-OR11-026]